MIDHTGIAVSPSLFDSVLSWYLAVLAPLGYTESIRTSDGAGLGTSREECDFWIGKDEKRGKKLEEGEGGHWAFRAKNRAAVKAFHATALEAGAKSNGPPGIREEYHPNYFAAFVFDPIGNNVEVVCHSPEKAQQE